MRSLKDHRSLKDNGVKPGSMLIATFTVCGGGGSRNNDIENNEDRIIQQMRTLYFEASQQMIECDKLYNQLNELTYSSVDTIVHSMDCIERIDFYLKQIGVKMNEIEYKAKDNMKQLNPEKKIEIVENADNKIMELSQTYCSLKSKFNQSQLKAIKASINCMK